MDKITEAKNNLVKVYSTLVKEIDLQIVKNQKGLLALKKDKDMLSKELAKFQPAKPTTKPKLTN